MPESKQVGPSETVVVELSREEAEHLADHPVEINRAIQRRAEAKLRAALASDSQGGGNGGCEQCGGSGEEGNEPCGECNGSGKKRCGHCEAVEREAAKSEEATIDLWFGHVERAIEEFDQRAHGCRQVGTNPEPFIYAREYLRTILRQVGSADIPAPTQPSISEGDRERVEQIANRIAEESIGSGDWWDCAAADLRRLASAPPEDSGEEFREPPEDLYREAESPPEPQALEREGDRWRVCQYAPSEDIHRETVRGSWEVRLRGPQPSNHDRLMPVSEHEATVERLKRAQAEVEAINEGGFDEVIELREQLKAMTDARDLCKRQTAEANQRHDQTKERLEKAYEVWEHETQRANDLQARLEEATDLAEKAANQGIERTLQRDQAWAALEEVAAEFERRSDKEQANAENEAEEACAATWELAAQHLREKQAALKGGGVGE